MAFAAARASPATTAVTAAAPTSSSSFPSLPSFLDQGFFSRRRRQSRTITTTTAAFSRGAVRKPSPLNRRSPRRGTAAAPSPDDESSGAIEAELRSLCRRAELRLQRLLAEAEEAYGDLRSSVRVVGGDRVVLTFRRSSLRFAAAALLWSLALSAAAWAFVGLSLRAWRRRGWWWGGREGGAVVRKRDRSLGGKEVVVAVSSSPPPVAPVPRFPKPSTGIRMRREPQTRVPEWWPEMGTEEAEPALKVEELAILANGLVRAIIDNTTAGRDYRYDDAIKLRQLCKISYAKVSFDTDNARDSFYRAATNFVLDDCSRAAQDMGVQINGESPGTFLAGLARNIGLDKSHAATLVCASVAARTRACLLQSWALEIQGKRPEALDELVKICRIHCVFPPEENSAEMEMVASGLKRSLKPAERVHLLSMYMSVCTAGNFRTAAEALGLSLPDQ